MLALTPQASGGAAGKLAGLVVPALAKRGVKVRGLIRTADDAEKVMKQGAAEVAVGDLRDKASIDSALKGVGILDAADEVLNIMTAFLVDTLGTASREANQPLTTRARTRRSNLGG
jgi:hypothetical protein